MSFKSKSKINIPFNKPYVDKVAINHIKEVFESIN